MAIGHYGRNMMTTKTIQISQTTTDKNGNTNLIPTQTPSVAAEMDVGSSYQLTRGLVTYDTEARDNRHEGSFLPLRADDGLLQGDKGNGGEGKRNLPFCSDRQGQKGGMDNGEGVNACTDGRGTGRRRRACLYAPGNRT